MNRKRTYIVTGFITLGFILAIFKLIDIQILHKDKYIKYIKRQYFDKEVVMLPRGTILDRNNRFLAISIPTLKIFIRPKFIHLNRDERYRFATDLSRLLKIPRYQILSKLNSHKRYLILASNIDKSLKPKIEQLRKIYNIAELGIIESSTRKYPFNEIAGSTIGYVRKSDGIGGAAMEYRLNDKLGGGLAEILFLKDASRKPFTIEKEPRKNKIENAVLTIDTNIQYMAEQALKELIKERHPKEAAVLIMNPKTGEILANATYPNYDPNIYWKFKNHKNVTFHNAYEIGSLAKPFILATAIQNNKIDLKQSIYCGNGKIKIDGVRIKDHKRYKYLTPAEILIHSSNVGAIKVAMELDPDHIYKKFRELGFGEKTGIFPGESSGIFRPFKRRIDVAYSSIGQSWTATPIQVAVAYSAIANGGYRIKPRLVKGFVDASGKYLEKTKTEVIDKVLDEKSVSWLKKVLTLVVEEGTARSGKSKYFTIAGKTGTAQKYDPKIKALSNEKFYTWFAGFFPVSNPEFTIVVFANEPKKIRKWEQIGGGKVSSTVLNNLIERLMFYYREKPDKNYLASDK